MEPAPKADKTMGEDEQDSKTPKGDKDSKAEKTVRKDRVMQWLPPFGKDDGKVIYETGNRITGVQYSEDCRWIFITHTVDGRREITGVDLTDPKKTYAIYKGSATEPKKDDAGRRKGDDDFDPLDDEQRKGFGGGAGAGSALGLMSRSLGGGVNVVRISSKGEVYVSGSDRARGAGKDSFSKPYIDAIDIKTGKKSRLFEGKGQLSESIDAVNGDDIKFVFTTRQKSNVVPDCYMIELGNEAYRERRSRAVVPRPQGRALPGDARRWVQVLGEGDHPAQGQAEVARDLLDLSARVRRPGRLRRRGGPRRARGSGRRGRRTGAFQCPHAAQHGDPDTRGLRGRGTGCANRRPHRAHERQLHPRSAQQPLGGD
jgi:hypothetical protein